MIVYITLSFIILFFALREVIRSRGGGALILSFLALPSFSGVVTYYNFAYGKGFRDSGGRYMAHIDNNSHYITYSQFELPSNYETGWLLAETVIGGEKDQTKNPPPDYVAMVYVGSFQVLDSNTNNIPPSLLGSPYTGSPLSSTDGSPNVGAQTPYQGSATQLFGSDGPSLAGMDSASGVPLDDIFYAIDSDGNSIGYFIRENGNNYELVDDSGNVVSTWDKSLGKYAPVTYKDSAGNIVQGYYDPSTGQFSSTRPSSGNGTDLTPVINAITTASSGVQGKQDVLRQELLRVLGSSGNGWVYDCKLSLDDLKNIASGLGIDVSSIESNLSSVKSDVAGILSSVQTSVQDNFLHLGSIANTTAANGIRLNTLHTDVENLRINISSDIAANGLRLNTVNSKLDDIYNLVDNRTDASSIPTLPTPDFGSTTPDEELPFNYNEWKSGTQVVFDWLRNTNTSDLPNRFPYISVLPGFLGVLIGTIPSVGSDPHMFDVDFDIPYVGHIQKSFSMSEWSIIPLFRSCVLWATYVFFALAIARVIFKAFI